MAEKSEMPTVLIVDDTPHSVEILRNALRTDYRVLIAISGRTALDIVQRAPRPDLILLDVMMPEMDGFEVCRQLKRHPETRDIPVIFLTARNSEIDEEIGLGLGALDYITKPFSVATIKARIRNHIRLAQQEKRLKQEISERKAAQEGLEVAYLVYSTTSEAVMLTDAADIIVAVNPAFCAMTGYSREEAIGKTPKLLNSGTHDAAFFQAMRENLAATGSWQGEIWNRRKNGELYAESITINTIFNEDGSVRQRVALFSDITRKKKVDEEVWQQANYDALTGLPNRRNFQDRLSQETKRASRDGIPLALLYIDLDRFKEVNDTLGHAQGDLLLVETARRLKQCVRESDTVARLSGDEFAIIQVDVNEETGVDRVATSIIRRLAEPFVMDANTATVSASVGAALYPDDATDMDELVIAADKAMYAAKRQGRNRYCRYSPTDRKQ